MRAVDIILKKREGRELDAQEMEFFLNGYIKGVIPDYQVSAWLMAVYFRGMTTRETALLTRVMIDSGKKYDLSSIPGSKIDKHSTGGVGDKVSLVLAPLAASLGLVVPMMAGRGLGHTGGTLDKLEAIPGYKCTLPDDRFLAGLKKNGYAIISQSDAVVPADKLLYALRDVTGTVESIPLITASILSKKCAEGAEGLVLDVKSGAGAFMKSREDAEALGHSLTLIGRELGKKIKVVITDMNEPLGFAIGNFLEIKEAADCLRGRGPADITEITCHLTACMLLLADMEKDMGTARARCRKQLESGAAWNKFLENVEYQGGDPCVFDHPEKAPAARYRHDVLSPAAGYIQNIDAFRAGSAAVILGAGRARKEDPVSPGAGIRLARKSGDRIEKGELFGTLFSDNSELMAQAEAAVLQALVIGDKAPVARSLVLKEL